MSEARELDLPIPPEAARQRADRFVADRSGLSRSFVQRLISEGHLTMNGLIVRASATLVPGETLHLVIPPVSETTLLAEDIPISMRIIAMALYIFSMIGCLEAKNPIKKIVIIFLN